MADDGFAQPDLSHLTEEERRQIQAVLQRQQQEEDSANQVVKNLAQEVQQIEQRVLQQKTQHQHQASSPFGGLKAGEDKEGLCDICQKVKFADGIGHACNFCHLHSCARCGSKAPIKNGKFIWICTLCRKKQELLKKTGKWYHGKGDELLAEIDEAALAGAGVGLSRDGTSLVVHHQPSATALVPLPSRSLQRQLSHDPNTVPRSALTGQQQRQQSLRRHDTISHNGPPQEAPRGDQQRRRSSLLAGGQLPSGAPLRQVPNSARSHAGPSPRTGGAPERCDQPVLGPPHAPPHAPHQPLQATAAAVSSTKRGSAHPPPPTSGGPSSNQRRVPSSLLRRAHSQDRYGVAGDYGNGSDYSEYDPRRAGHWQPSPPDRHTLLNNRPTVQGQPRSASAASGLYPQFSFSSSEEEMQSNISEFTMADDGSLRSYDSHHSIRTHPDLRHVSSARGLHRSMWRQASQQEQGYYSQEGYTSSDSRTGSRNVVWRESEDGRRMIGRLVLHCSDQLKNGEGGMPMQQVRGYSMPSQIGVRVEGGKRTASGRLAAYIIRVKRGSVADVVGQLRPGDEVLEWNGIVLRGLAFHEVYSIVEDSRQDTQLHLLVSRKRQRGPSSFFQARPPPPAGLSSSGPSPALPYVSGRIQLSLYYSLPEAQLSVTVIQAAELLPRHDGQDRNAYAKLYLLPTYNEQMKHRTKIMYKTNDPQWQQIFYYGHLKESEMLSLTLVVTVWDYERQRPTSNECIGEVSIQLEQVWLNDEPSWYYLTYPDVELQQQAASSSRSRRYQSMDDDFGGPEGLSPTNSPSASRLSGDSILLDEMEVVDRRRQQPLSLSASRHNLAQQGGYYDRTLESPRNRHRSSTLEGQQFYRQNSGDFQQPPSHFPNERRGRRERYEYNEESPEGGSWAATGQAQRGQRRSAHHSAPPVERDQPYFNHYDQDPAGPYSDQNDTMANSRRPASSSSRKRHLPILPNDNHGRNGPMTSSSSHERRTSLLNHQRAEGPAEHNLALSLSVPPLAAQAPSSPTAHSSSSRHSNSNTFNTSATINDNHGKAPLMQQQFHHQTLKVPGSEDDEVKTVPASPRSRLDHMSKKNSSQEENLDPSLLLSVDAAGNTSGHSRSSSLRRSFRGSSSNVASGATGGGHDNRKPSVSLSRSSEPTDNDSAGDLSLLLPSSPIERSSGSQRHRKHSDLQRLRSLDLDESGSQASGVTAINLGSLASGNLSDGGTSQPGKKMFDYDEFQTRFLNQQTASKNQQKSKSSAKAAAILGLKKDSKRPTFTRSEEVGHQSPASLQRHALNKQMSKDSTDGSVSSGGHIGRSHHRGDHSHLASFVDGLGPGQVVGRQVLASPCLGEIQLHIKYSKGTLEVEVVRAKGLIVKGQSRGLPATYVKVYLMEDKRIIAKAKTNVARRCLDPLYQQTLAFDEDYQRRQLQVSCWGDFGRMEKKVFMGVALINMEDLDLTTIIIGWYKLFDSATVVAPNSTKSSSLYAASVSGVASNNSSLDDNTPVASTSSRPSPMQTQRSSNALQKV